MPVIQVLKHGAVSLPVDIGSFSGFEELTQALAHMFGMEGQLKVGQTTGWICIYQDVEGDILLLGDGLWQMFAMNVRRIWILPSQAAQRIVAGGRLRSRL